jgi:hypothetical protein
MATRKTTENLAARQYVKGLVDSEEIVSNDAADRIVDLFDTAEFETATSRVGGTDITLRRVVLTGPWEVAPK